MSERVWAFTCNALAETVEQALTVLREALVHETHCGGVHWGPRRLN